jgi:hypothetical protein
MKKISFIIILLLTVIGFFLRVLPFGYGMSYIDFSDTFLFSKALDLANGITHNDFSQFKNPSHYPYFSSYLLLSIFGVFYAIGLIIGVFSSASEFLNYVILHIEQLFEISRIVIAVFGTLLIPLVYLVTKKILSGITKKWADIGALLSAFLMCFSLLHIHYSHLVRPHLLVAFMIFLSFYVYLFLIEKKTLSLYILLGLVGGLTLGTLHNGFLVIFVLIIGHFLIIQERGRAQNIKFKIKNFVSLNFLFGLSAFFLTTVICWPYVLLNLKKALFLDNKINVSLSGQYVTVGGFTGKGWITALKGLILSESGLIVLLITLILYLVALKKQKGDKYSIENFKYRAGITGALFILISHFLVLGAYGTTEYKFAVPLVPFLSMFAGILFGQIMNLVARKKHFYLKILIVIFLVFSTIQSIRLSVLVIRKDTRELAAEWIEKNINSSQMIAISSGGPKFFPSQESLKVKLSLAGPNSLGKRDNLLLTITPENYPANSRTIFPLWAFDENEARAYNFIKTQVDYFIWANQSAGYDFSSLRDTEKQMGTRLGKLVATFGPFKKPSKITSGFPTQIYNPIIDLWTLNRMGPIIEIYKINN